MIHCGLFRLLNTDWNAFKKCTNKIIFYYISDQAKCLISGVLGVISQESINRQEYETDLYNLNHITFHAVTSSCGSIRYKYFGKKSSHLLFSIECNIGPLSHIHNQRTPEPLHRFSLATGFPSFGHTVWMRLAEECGDTIVGMSVC